MSLRQMEEKLDFLKSRQWENQGYCCLLRSQNGTREHGFLLSDDVGIRVYVGNFFAFLDGQSPSKILEYASFDSLIDDQWTID